MSSPHHAPKPKTSFKKKAVIAGATIATIATLGGLGINTMRTHEPPRQMRIDANAPISRISNEPRTRLEAWQAEARRRGHSEEEIKNMRLPPLPNFGASAAGKNRAGKGKMNWPLTGGITAVTAGLGAAGVYGYRKYRKRRQAQTTGVAGTTTAPQKQAIAPAAQQLDAGTAAQPPAQPAVTPPTQRQGLFKRTLTAIKTQAQSFRKKIGTWRKTPKTTTTPSTQASAQPAVTPTQKQRFLRRTLATIRDFFKA